MNALISSDLDSLVSFLLSYVFCDAADSRRPPLAKAGLFNHSVGCVVGGSSAPRTGSKVGQGLLFAIVCNCTHVNSHSLMPTVQTTLSPQGFSQPSRGGKNDPLL